MSRLLIIAVLLGATIGLPYLASRYSRAGAASSQEPAASQPPDAAAASALAPSLASGAGPAPLLGQGPGSSIYVSPAPLEGARFHSVEQVLRFDVTREWVYQNWARKSTGLTDVGLFGVRVPLITGTQIGALAGSLTYYFNTQGQVEHISFRGRTGDTTQLVNFLTRTYAFQRAEAPAGEQHYLVKRGDRLQSELRTRPESVLWSTSPHGSFDVELELARPGSKRRLPPRGPYLEIPPVASTTPAPAAASDEAADPSKGAGILQPYLDKFRYATPQEEGQVLWKRWPN
jgi:hypothetical protein